jgi:hypothetical protein
MSADASGYTPADRSQCRIVANDASVEQRTGTGEVFERGRLRGTLHYTLNVYQQQYDEGQDEAVTGVGHIEGRLTSSGPVEIPDPGAGAPSSNRAARTDGR